MLTITYGNFVNLKSGTVDETLRYSSSCTVRITEMNQTFYYKQMTTAKEGQLNVGISRKQREELKKEHRGYWVTPNLALVHYFMPNAKRGESIIHLQSIPDFLVDEAMVRFGDEFPTRYLANYVLTELGLTFDLRHISFIRAIGGVYETSGYENHYELIYNGKKYDMTYLEENGKAGIMVEKE